MGLPFTGRKHLWLHFNRFLPAPCLRAAMLGLDNITQPNKMLLRNLGLLVYCVPMFVVYCMRIVYCVFHQHGGSEDRLFELSQEPPSKRGSKLYMAQHENAVFKTDGALFFRTSLL